MNSKHRILPAATVIIMMSVTAISKILGMLRSVLLASACGTGAFASAFAAAVRIPVSVFDILLGSAVTGCFIPVYGRLRGGKRQFSLTFFNFISIAAGVAALIGILFADKIIFLTAPGLGDSERELAAKLLAILFPSIIAVGGTYVLTAMSQSRGKYILPAAVSVVSNLFVILYFLFIKNIENEIQLMRLAAVYASAWFIQLLTMAVPLFFSGSRYSLKLHPHCEGFGQALRNFPSASAAEWMVPFSLLAGMFFSSMAEANGSAVFDYSAVVFTVVTGVLASGVINYVFPMLSNFSSDEKSFRNKSAVSVETVLAISVLAAAGMSVFSKEIVSVLYLRNKFTQTDAAGVSAIISIIAVAIPFAAVSEMLRRIFQASGRSKPAAMSAFAGVLASVAASIALYFAGFGIKGSAAAFVFGHAVSAVYSIISAKNQLSLPFRPESFLRPFFSGSAGATVMYAVKTLFGGDPYKKDVFSNIAVCVVSFTAGAAVYTLIYFTLKHLSQRKEATASQ